MQIAKIIAMVTPTSKSIQHRCRFTLSKKREIITNVETLKSRGVPIQAACVVFKIHHKQYYDWSAKIKEDDEKGTAIVQSKKSQSTGGKKNVCLNTQTKFCDLFLLIAKMASIFQSPSSQNLSVLSTIFLPLKPPMHSLLSLAGF